MNPVTKTKSISRINKIKKLKILPEIYDENLDNIFEEDFKYKWMTSDTVKYTKVQVNFSLSNNENIRQQIKARLEKTKRKGSIKQHIDENTIIYETYTTDEKELVPWINGFGRYAHVIKSINTRLYNKLKEHNDELMVKYGLIL